MFSTQRLHGRREPAMQDNIGSRAFDAHGNTHATTDTKCGKAFFRTAALHLEKQRVQDPST